MILSIVSWSALLWKTSRVLQMFLQSKEIWASKTHKTRNQWNMYTHHSINRKQLVSTFESSMPFCYSSRNYARNINRRILFFSPHHIKTKAFISLWQFYHSRVWMAFTRCKGSNCCLEENEILAIEATELEAYLPILSDRFVHTEPHFAFLVCVYKYCITSLIKKHSSIQVRKCEPSCPVMCQLSN